MQYRKDMPKELYNACMYVRELHEKGYDYGLANWEASKHFNYTPSEIGRALNEFKKLKKPIYDWKHLNRR